MPLRNALPEREMQIAARVMKLRRMARLSRADLADRMCLDSSAIARVELGRVPLKYLFATDLLSTFMSGKVSPLWLAFGSEPMLVAGYWGVWMPSAEALGFKDSTPFSKVMDQFKGQLDTLAGHYQKWDLPKPWLKAQLSHAKWELECLCQQIASWQSLVTSAEGKLGTLDFSESEVASMTIDEIRELRAAGVSLPSIGSPSVFDEKKDVDALVTFGNVGDVKTRWQQVLKRLQKVTEASGMKARLARDLKVPLASASRWANGKRMPGADTALKIIAWVEARERELQKPT